MKQKSIALGVISLIILASFTVLLDGSTVTNAYKSNWIIKSNKEMVHSTIWSSRGSPPSPPVIWTENFFDFYIHVSQNPEEDQIYYMIDWGDGTSSGWIGPFEPGVTITISHIWDLEGTYQIMVKAKNQDGVSNSAVYVLGLFSDFKYFFVTLGYVSITYIFTILFDEAIYYLFDWGDGNNSGWLGPYNSGQTGVVSHCWTKLGIYNIKWKAKDIYGNATPWSDPYVLTIADGNQPPKTPDIRGPDRVKKGVIYLYNALTTDPDGDCVYYFFDWGDGTTSGWLGPYPSGQMVHITHSWGFVGTCTVKVKAIDVYGAESDWGTLPVRIPFSFDIPFLSFFEWLIIHFPIAFPILRYLLDYT